MMGTSPFHATNGLQRNQFYTGEPYEMDIMSRQYVQLGEWIDDFGRRARAAQDQQRISLHNINHIAFDLQEKNPEKAFALYREGVALAEQLGEAWMALFYEYWSAVTLIFCLDRYEDGLALAAQLVARVSQEAYINCPFRARIYMTLVSAYFQIDPLSYVDQIRSMIDTLDTQIPLDEDTYRRLYAYRAKISMELFEYDSALPDALKYLEVSTSSAFRTAYAYSILTHLSYIQGKDGRALDYVYLLQSNAQRANLYSLIVSSYYWQALFLCLRGEAQEAHRLFLLGTAEANGLGRRNEDILLMGVSRYFEARGDYDKALAVWDEQVQLMDPKTPHRQSYFYTFLRRCFVLRRMGRLAEADIEQTHQAALRMHKPDRYVALVDELRNGKIEIPRY
jgi:hypothetical protein